MFFLAQCSPESSRQRCKICGDAKGRTALRRLTEIWDAQPLLLESFFGLGAATSSSGSLEFSVKEHSLIQIPGNIMTQ